MLKEHRLIPFSSILIVILVTGWFFLLTVPVFATETNEKAEKTVQIPPASYVGGQVCANCHPQQHTRWSGSHHDLAMQVANQQTMLGDFNDTQFSYYGLTSTFYKRDGKFMVRTDGPDGKLHDYEIQYTFGVYPLQQYLIEFPDGRLQALGIAWDSRPAGEGGQRWFHLYPDENIAHDDILHWTGLNQNWNYMCAECHSTDLKKHYDLKTNRYRTTWSEIDVSCEACHGPGSRHVAWAEHEPDRTDTGNGLVVRFAERAGVEWLMDLKSGDARRNRPKDSNLEIEMCARCHSRRGMLLEDYVHGRPFMDTHLPQLLTEGMYHANGQIQDEVYVYGSFLQSQMHGEGVTCSDCHDPHSLELRAAGNSVCAQCHLSKKYDTASHHFHEPGSTGASCAECHMPPSAYMVVDPRHDHSMRIPRPDLSVAIGTPNACNQCHTDRSAQWAAAQVKQWYGKQPTGHQDFAETLHAARTRAVPAEQRLVQLAGNTAKPNIARATALAQLGSYLSPVSIDVVVSSLQDKDPMVRRAALDALEALNPQARLQLAFPLLQDPVRAVRIQTARLLASTPTEELTDRQRTALEQAFAEYVAVQQANAERPEAHLNLGILYAERGELEKAALAYQTALKLQPSFVQAYVNLADLYRLQAKDEQGKSLLQKALEIAPEDADVHHALGLLLVRQKQLNEAVGALAQAVVLNPTNPRYSYVYAVALNTNGNPDEAIRVLEKNHRQNPNDREVLYALVTFHRDQGNDFAARLYAQKLAELSPQDPSVRRLLEQLK